MYMRPDQQTNNNSCFDPLVVRLTVTKSYPADRGSGDFAAPCDCAEMIPIRAISHRRCYQRRSRCQEWRRRSATESRSIGSKALYR